MPRPTTIHVTRKQNDTCAEVFHIDTDVSGATFALNVEGLGALTGSITSAAATLSVVSFPCSVAGVYGGSAGAYDYDVVMTSGGLTRTLVEGTWTIEARTAS